MKTSLKPLAAALSLACLPVMAADHLDSPLVQSDPAADINDLYAFVNPNNPDELILAATVLPIATERSRFSSAVEYRFNIANFETGEQTLIGCRALGKKARGMRCSLEGTDTVAGKTNRINVNDAGDLRLFAGLRDDPFFFDLVAYQQTVATVSPQFTDPGTDFFDGLGTLAIVIGIDSDLLTDDGANPVLSVWSSTVRADAAPLKGSASKGAKNASQVDRMGRPAINTALIDLFGAMPSLTDDYNTADDPSSWSQFEAEMEANLTALDTLDGVVGNTLLPPMVAAQVFAADTLLIDTNQPLCDAYLAVELGVPQCGGRTLQRDVIDDTLGAVVGPGVSDFVDDTNTFLASFPFIGPAN